ncbi:hypothetical protein NKR23_g6667 [Pleurostoma richardsiae]|uniref:Uncharacterized protein n=1 Tax=Pleurostoma richardsiae TaxID=41990 RepID=A0AA38VS53_9PEZI|nr:hypothetical protein NKR23_g6667 [Pleurostoma richardsiae]
MTATATEANDDEDSLGLGRACTTPTGYRTLLTTRPPSYKDDLKIQRLNQLCLPDWDRRIRRAKTRALRPERPEFAIVKQSPANPKWMRALRQIEKGIGPLNLYIKEMGGYAYLKLRMKPVLRSVAVILYDRECSGRPMEEVSETRLEDIPEVGGRKLRSLVKPLLEHMLLVDYGVGVYPLKGRKRVDRGVLDFCNYVASFVEFYKNPPLPDLPRWEYLASRLLRFEHFDGLDVADISLALYHYGTHRRQLADWEYKRGLTGYTGVLQEMIDEIPTRGTERLMRKLSVDVNEYLSKQWCIEDTEARRKVAAKAKELASQYGLPLYAPPVTSLSMPEFEKIYKNGIPLRK